MSMKPLMLHILQVDLSRRPIRDVEFSKGTYGRDGLRDIKLSITVKLNIDSHFQSAQLKGFIGLILKCVFVIVLSDERLFRAHLTSVLSFISFASWLEMFIKDLIFLKAMVTSRGLLTLPS
ncbi:unnamed protein product [Somion occarium]|uniref:Uncharacterized protein n=1 Tax=Somion occarium TaxID=3059160 RepID=A0ABP1DEQ4_9APHY